MSYNQILQQQNLDIRELINIANSLPAPIQLQEKTIDIITNSSVEVIPDSGYALSKVTANVNVPIPDGYIIPNGINEITENGIHDVTEYANVNVNVPIPDGYIKPSGELEITENGQYNIAEKASVVVDVPERQLVLQPLSITENGIYSPDEGYDGFEFVTVNVAGGGGDSTNYTKFTVTPDSTTSFIIENPLGGIAKKVSIKAISPTVTSSRKIHECCLDWDAKLGAVKAYYSSGSVTYVMTGIEGTPNNGNFRMTDGFITVYRFNSSTTWDTTCEYEVEIYQ